MTRVYVASNIPTSYPHKLQKPSTVNAAVRDTADSFIMDSGIGDDTTNEQVLDLAHKYDADYVIAKDYLHDQDRTAESVHEFFDLYPDHPCDATPMVPLQPPFENHLTMWGLEGFDHYVLGGLVDYGWWEQLPWIRGFREKAGWDVYAHGLGVGGGIEFVSRVAKTGLLDSIDCSTPEQAATFGSVLGTDLEQIQVRVGNGEGSSKRTHALAEFNSWQVADVWEREADSTYRQGRLPGVSEA